MIAVRKKKYGILTKKGIASSFVKTENPTQAFGNSFSKFMFYFQILQKQYSDCCFRVEHCFQKQYLHFFYCIETCFLEKQFSNYVFRDENCFQKQ